MIILSLFMEYLDILATIAISLFVTDTIGKKNKINVATKQMEHVYLPMFKRLEPSLYDKEIYVHTLYEILLEYNIIICNHYELVNPTIRHLIDVLLKSLSDSYKNDQKKLNKQEKAQFIKLCTHIDSDYARCSKTLKLPKRSYFYRYEKKQAKNYFKIIVYSTLSDKYITFLIIFLIIYCFLIIVEPFLAL